jgi:hypothetical protein
MDMELKERIKDIANKVNDYAESSSLDCIVDIEGILGTLLDTKTVKFWRYNKSDDTLVLKDTNNGMKVSLTSSVTREAIVSKKPILANHITSDKYYNTDIDNPLGLKIRALMVYPICEGSSPVGVLKFWRGTRQKKVFTRHDEEVIKYFEPLFVKLFKKESIEKEELLGLLGEKIENAPKRVKEEKPSQKNVSEKREKSSEDDKSAQALKELQKTYDETLGELELYKEKLAQQERENKEALSSFQKKLDNSQKTSSEIDGYKLTVKQLEKKEKEYLSQIEESASSLKLLEEDYDRQERKIKEGYEEKIALLKNDIQDLKAENRELKEEFQVNAHNIQKIKAEMSMASQSGSFAKLDENIEYIFEKVDTTFGEDEYSMIMFEMIIYALSSKKGLEMIEEKIRDSKVLNALLDSYYFKTEIPVCTEKTQMQDVVEHIQRYEASIFTNNCLLRINVDDSVPSSLVFDAPKIQSIAYHLLTDLYQFIDYSKSVDVLFKYQNKFMQIEIGGYIHEKNSLFKSIFKQTKMGGDEKDRLGLRMSRKLIERLKGKLDIDYSDAHYTFLITIPALKIKM